MRIFYFFCVAFFWIVGAFADWNVRFDEESQFLWTQLESLETKEYRPFMDLRRGLLQDASFRRQLAATQDIQRIVFLKPREGLVVKKRAYNRIHEFFAWELATLLGLGNYVVPSFPVEIAGKRVIVQRMEPFTFGGSKTQMPPSAVVKKVSTETYWKAHLAAYLIGLGDMVGKNIGVSSEGIIRFFDLEYSLHFHNKPYRTDRSFKVGFTTQSLEWPQYRYRLDAKTAQHLQEFVSSLSSMEDKIQVYLSCRFLPFEFDLEGFLQRLENVRRFSFEEGKSFRDFYGSLFPRVSLGLDSLVQLAENIFGQKMGHGSALVLICRRLEPGTLTKNQRRDLEKWIKTYID